MAEQTINLDGLRSEVRDAVGTLAARLTKDLGDNLRSLAVVGSALTADFHARRSDINTVVVVGRRSHELLRLLASYGGTMGRLRLHAPLLMTEEHLDRSRDVFGVELLDFQLNHHVVLGPDPFAALTFAKADVQLQCERELKAAVVELQQGYVRSAGNAKIVGQLLMACLGKLLPLMRAMLWLKDAPRVAEAERTVQDAAGVFGFEAAAFGLLLVQRAAGKIPAAKDVETTFQNVYRATDHLSRVADKMQMQEAG